jgi:excisionase family DNA binding protein
MSEAKQISMSTEPTVESLMAELRGHISKELKGAVVEKPMGTKEAALFLGIHENTIYKWLKNKTLPASLIHRIGSSMFFFPSELHEYVKRS